MKTTIQRLLPRATAASTSALRWPAKIEMMTSVPIPKSCPSISGRASGTSTLISRRKAREAKAGRI